MKYLILIGLLSLPFWGSAQKEDHQWIFNFSSVDSCDQFSVLGTECGASILDFNTLPPIGYRQKEITLDFNEEHGAICDHEGQLLFYSNGQSIHGPDYQAVENGEIINFSPKWTALTWANEHGEEKPSGMRYVQAMGFIPIPQSDTILALYHNYENFDLIIQNGFFSLWSSKIIPNNQGYTIVEKDKVLDNNVRLAGNLHACKHANGRDWWLLQFYGKTYKAYLITPQGISSSNELELPFELRPLSQGQSKFSPQGNKFALYGRNQIGTSDGIDLMIADFDRCTGELFNAVLDTLPSIDNVISNGLEFSPNGKLLYISTHLNIFQYDLEAQNVFDSKQTVATYDGTLCEDAAESPNVFGLMQRGADNKIYIGRAVQCFNIHVINDPDVRGEACNVGQNQVFLPTYTNGTIPNFNTYRLGPLDGSLCDTLDLDNLPQARFWYESKDSLNPSKIKFWDVSYFRPEAWSWDFGDGAFSNEKSPTHRYKETGSYEVCLTVSNENSSHTFCKTLIIGTVDTEDIEIEVDINIFPNPVHSHTRIAWTNYVPVKPHMTLTNSTGQLIYSEKLFGTEQTIDLSLVPSGFYYLNIYENGIVVKSEGIVRI